MRLSHYLLYLQKRLSMDVINSYKNIERHRLESVTDSLKHSTVKSRIYQWKKQGLLSSVRKGVYMPADLQDKFRIACNAVENGCLVYHGALEFYLLQTQEFNWLYIHSSSPFRTFNYQNEKYIYKPVKFLYHPVIIDGEQPYPIRVTSLSQTVVDCLYNINLAGGLEELLYALSEVSADGINEDEMLQCLAFYNNKSLYQRTGYILCHFKDTLKLSEHFFEVCKSGMGKSISYLVNPYYCDSFSKEWNLCVPQNMMNQIQKESLYEV